MRKVFISAVALTVGGLMLHGAVARELNREASQPVSAIILGDGCGGLNGFVNPPDALTPLGNENRSPVDPVKDCGAVYFDHATYWGINGLLGLLVASLGAESQYKPDVGFSLSPMDANAQFR